MLVSLAVLLPTIFIGVTSWRSLRRHFADAEDRLSRTLSVVHEHAVKVFETQELVALQVDTLLDGLTDEEVQSRELTLNTRLKTLIAALPQIQDIWVIDKNGHPLLTGNIFPAPRTLDLSDREYFRIQRDDSFDPERLTLARFFRVEPRTSFFFLLSRRRSQGDEPIMPPAFTGVTAVSIAQAYFNRYFADLTHGGGFATAILVREDGAVLARYPALPIGEHGPPRLSSSSGFMQALRANQERGFYTTISFFDGVERTLTYARLPRYPVYVAVGFDTGSVWQTWRAEVMGQLAFVVPLVLIALLALRRAQREIAAVQERRRAEAQMQELRAELLHVSRLAAMGQMASVLAHELNQPLAAASNYLGAAKRLPVVDGSRAMAFVDKAGQQILRAGEIIQRLRDFVSKGQLTRHVMDIGPVLKESVALALMDRSHREHQGRRACRPWRALCADRPGPDPAGAGEPDPQCGRGDGGEPSAGDHPGNGASRGWPDRSQCCGYRIRAGGAHRWPLVSAVRHGQTRRDGDGSVDLPDDRRSAWRAYQGGSQPGGGYSVPLHAGGSLNSGRKSS